MRPGLGPDSTPDWDSATARREGTGKEMWVEEEHAIRSARADRGGN